MEYSHRIVDAFALAFELHRRQFRKGSEVPYLTHLVGAAALVGQHGGDEDQFIAALLHDAVEDQGGRATLDRIRDRFGEGVAGYVAACSDSDTTPKPPWRERKEKYIERAASCTPRQKLIIAADKLHNTRCMIADLRERGNALWEIFQGGRDGTLWYHAEILRALGTDWSHPLLRELADAVDALHRVAFELEDRE